MKIYIPYFVNTFDDKEELDRKVGLVVRKFLENEDNTASSIFSVTFVSLDMGEYKYWLNGEEDNDEAKNQFLQEKMALNELEETTAMYERKNQARKKGK